MSKARLIKKGFDFIGSLFDDAAGKPVDDVAEWQGSLFGTRGGWDESAWLADNPEPFPGIELKDLNTEQRKAYQNHAAKKSGAKSKAEQSGVWNQTQWEEANPKPPEFDIPKGQRTTEQQRSVKKWSDAKKSARGRALAGSHYDSIGAKIPEPEAPPVNFFDDDGAPLYGRALIDQRQQGKVFNEDAWVAANPKPDGPSQSMPVATWRQQKRTAQKRAESYGYDDIGGVRYVDDEGNVIPRTLPTDAQGVQIPADQRTPEQSASFQAYSNIQTKKRADAANPNRVTVPWSQRTNLTPEQAEYIRRHPRPFEDMAQDQRSPEQQQEYRNWLGRFLHNTDPDFRERRLAKSRVENLSEEERLRRNANASERGKQAYRDKPGYYTEKSRSRKQGIGQQTPAHANEEAINEIYRQRDILNEAARRSGSDQVYVIDHAVPLRAQSRGRLGDEDLRTASGLHVQDNLLIVPKDMNATKGPYMDPGADPMRMNDVARRRLLGQAEEGLLGPLK